MEFKILGPLVVMDGSALVPVPGIKERSVLAILLLHANELVSADRLIEELWSDEPPTTARKSLQVRVANLRKALGTGGALIATQAPGYVARVQPEQLDLHRFERLMAAAEGVEPSIASARLREALALWRDAPLADLRYEEFAQGPIRRLEEIRLATVENRIEAELALGRHVDLARELEGLVAAHPLRERLREQLMLSLYRSGRQAEALEQYRSARAVLSTELGLEPGPSLQRLERAILTQDPELDVDSELRAQARAPMPSGTVTFLFSDIQDSSSLVRRLGEGYGELLRTHRTLVREACRARNGYEVDAQGDALFFAFGRALDAVESSIALQRAHAAQRWPEGADVHVRIGVHTGTPSVSEDGYYGVDVIRGARICAAGHGEQILLSEATRTLIQADQLDRFRLRELGERSLKGLDQPVRLFQIAAEGMREDFPALRTQVARVDLVDYIAPSTRSIMVSAQDPERLDALLAIGEAIALRSSRELILVRPIGSDESLPDATASLNRCREDLLARGLAVRAAAFTSSSPAADLVRAVAEQDVDLLLIDAPAGLLDDVGLASVLRGAACDVAVLAGGDRALEPGPVLVPFGGADHDWTAVELAARIAGTDQPLWLAGTSDAQPAAGRDASRLLANASLAVQRGLGVAAAPLLVPSGSEGLVQAADEAALVVVGLSDRWQREGLGTVRRAVALEARPPVLLVRRGLRPGVIVPPQEMTRFTWTIKAG